MSTDKASYGAVSEDIAPPYSENATSKSVNQQYPAHVCSILLFILVDYFPDLEFSLKLKMLRL